VRRRLYTLLKSIRPAPVLVVGDVILDRYILGAVERISPEAPVQVFEVSGEYDVLGGAANVAANVAGLGGRAFLAGVVGRDDDARLVRSILKKWRISADGLTPDPSRPTTRKTRLMALRQQMLRVDRENRHEVSREVGDRMLERIEKYLPRCGGVIVSDYGKGAAPAWLLKRLFRLCKTAGKEVIVDPKGKDYSIYAGASVITPNKMEAAAASGVDIVMERDYALAARRLFRTTGARRLVITRGAEGMSVFGADGSCAHLKAEALEVFDVSGAGDTVIAAIGALYFSGAPLEDAAAVANVAAGIEVGHLGARPVTREEVLASLDEDGPGAGKLMTQRQAGAYASRQRALGRAVVFTNGCFDLLHAGHVQLLRQARALGDCLVVGLNTDASIRRLKGASRPLLDETDRVEILAALDCVDAVTLFSEDTPLSLISTVKPDVLVKGGDYRVVDVVGREVVENRGGRVEIIPLVEGKSTSALIDAIVHKHGRGARR